MSQPADHAAYLRQLGRWTYEAPETWRPFLAELSEAELQQVATEVRNERIVREARYQPLQAVMDELTCAQDSAGAALLPQG